MLQEFNIDVKTDEEARRWAQAAYPPCPVKQSYPDKEHGGWIIVIEFDGGIDNTDRYCDEQLCWDNKNGICKADEQTRKVCGFTSSDARKEE